MSDLMDAQYISTTVAIDRRFVHFFRNIQIVFFAFIKHPEKCKYSFTTKAIIENNTEVGPPGFIKTHSYFWKLH